MSREESNFTTLEMQGDMSSFYSREFHAKRSVADERLIFRWLQLMERHCSVYNVNNKHDCLRADREEKERAHREHNQPPLKPVVIQPFASVDNFFGCLVCGKYHLCRLRRETCQVIVEKVDKQKVCAYSGQLLHIQDNLEIGNFDDERAMDQEATLMTMPRRLRTTRSSPKKTSHKGHIVQLFKETVQQQQPTPSLKRSRPPAPSKSDCRVILGDTYDLSVDSTSDTTSEEEEEEEGTPPPLVIQNHVEEEEENEKVIEEDEEDDICVQHAKRQRTTKKPVEEEEDDESSEGEEDDITQREEEEEEEDNEYDQCGTEYENENGEGGHAKNYHNNIRYKNEYYAFLQHTLRKQRKTEHQMSRYDKFIDLYARDMNEGVPVMTSDDNQEEEVFAASAKLSDSVCEKIESEVTVIVEILFGMDKTQRPLSRLKPSKVCRTLVAYYVTLIKNVTLLVYHSPHLHKVAMKRATKNHTQTTKFTASVIEEEENGENDIAYHEFTLSPTKIVRSLLLHLFTKTFWVADSLGFNVNIWGIDRWLRLFMTPNDDRQFLAAYHKQSTGGVTSSEETDRYCKEIYENAALVEKCLRYYRFCPLWLRSMIFLHIV